MLSISQQTPVASCPADKHDWFMDDLNVPKMRALESSVFDDLFFWGASRFTNDQDQETAHQPGKQRQQRHSRHRGEEDLPRTLLWQLNNQMMLHGAMGMRFGSDFCLTFGKHLRQKRDPRHPHKLWKLFRPTLRIPSDGSHFECNL